MSQRVKKPGRPADESQGKRRRRRPSGSEAEDDGARSGTNSGGNGSLTGMWTPRHLNDLKVSSIYNRNSAEAPAELYRKDLISAMKLPDGEPLTPEEYWLITDSWKQEWEKGVQVPVNPESLPEPEVKLISPVAERSHDFRLPKKKYVRVTHDDFFNPDYHQLVSTAARAEKVCSYDLDDVDAAWLGCSNADRAMQNNTVVSEFCMEQVIEELELQCWDHVQTILKSQEGLGIEYDENVICDVCRSPESEEGNEMVFCDSCNICVHQACYGITTIPSGSFLCKTCTLGIKPACLLCPNMGGAMKATRSGQTWTHVACAIWIPEVSIGSVEKMEPITKISAVPQSRWSLLCVLCKDKTGACIQCSVRACKTAYHVTCAFKNGLEMKPIIVDENAEDGIKLRSYCLKHSVNARKEKALLAAEEDAEKKKVKAMTAEERNQARADKLQQIESEFFKYVRLKDVSQNLAVDMDIVMLIYNYWKLKRKSLNNRPLVPPRPETTQLLTQQQEQDLEQMKMFVQLRQDLERVRNLCYMVSRREKLSRSFFRLKEQTFQKQLVLLTENNELTPEERQAVLHANHGPSIYDQFYSSPGAKSMFPDYDTMISLIGGMEFKKEPIATTSTPTTTRGGKRGALAAPVASTSKQAAAAAASSALNKEQSGSTKSSASATVASGVNNERTGGNKKQFVNGARRRNAAEAESHSESETYAKGDSKSTPPAAGKKMTAAAKAAATKAAAAKAAATKAAAAAKAAPKGGKTVPAKAAPAKTKSAAIKAAAASKVAAKGGRKPLSYLFDSDSSVDGGTTATPAATTPAKKGAAAAAAAKKGGAKAKGKSPAKAPCKVANLSDSDELELPVGRNVKVAAAPNVKNSIYSDSESEDAKPPNSALKKDQKGGKVPPKEKGGKKGKAAEAASPKKLPTASDESPKGKAAKKKATIVAAVAAAALAASSPVKGKGKGAGKKGKNKGFDPTELIVPQREAAKKATESIRSVKQKKEQATLDTIEAVVTGTAAKEPLDTSPGKAKVAAKVSTLSDSESEEKVVVKPKKAEKAKSPERKVAVKTSKRGAAAAAAAASSAAAAEAAALEEAGLSGDEFDFDDTKEGKSGKNVSYVPQRQAAKKAAEHIRSGLSNIVAARLIIEDEMELARKKQKLEKGAKGIPGLKTDEDGEEVPAAAAVDSANIESAVAEAAKKVTNKDRAVAKNVGAKGGKGGVKKEVVERESPVAASTKAAGAGKEARGVGDTDWPFLDKGSQSACRRSRERSSSSSSSGSSGSSSSGSSSSSRSSSSSSQSSSAESASPKPSPVTNKKASNPKLISPLTSAKLPTPQDSGPGRKLKTSERCPSRRLRAETPPREKPTPKGGRPGKSGSGRGDPFRSAFSSSPEPQPNQAESRDSSPELRQRDGGTKRPSNTLTPPTPTTGRKPNERQQQRVNSSKNRSPVSAGKSVAASSPQKKGARRKGESPKGAQIEKDSDVPAAKAGGKRPPQKALARKSPVKHTGPHLSSESETEAPPPEPKPKANVAINSRSRNNSHSSLAPNESMSPRLAAKRKSDGNIGLSDSEESGTEEKENSCVAAESQPSSLPPSPAAAKTPKSQKNSTPVPTMSILSPLTPSDNKDKEQPSLPRESEPDSKRARLDPSTQSSSFVPSTSASGQLKSIFSPPGAGREGEILDFDSELYDLARSVTDDYTHVDDAPSSGSLSFSFSQELFGREDNKEDSARATLNLVEKLRLQHARMSGAHRPSTESSSDLCEGLIEDRSPTGSERKVEEDEREEQALSLKAEEKAQSIFEPCLKSPNMLQTATSPGRSKSIQGDERWVPPSSTPGRPPTTSHVDSPHRVNQPLSSSASIPGGIVVPTPRTSASSYVSIPESSPPLASQHQQSHSRGKGSIASPLVSPVIDGEGDRHRLRSPSYAHARSHSRSSTDNDKAESLKSQSHHSGGGLSVDTVTSPPVTSPMVSPLLPGPSIASPMVSPLMRAHPSQALPFGHDGNLAGLAFGTNPFMYPAALANNPAFVSALAAAAGSNSLASFLQATQVPIPKTSPGLLQGPGSPMFPQNAFPPFISPSLLSQQPPHSQMSGMPGATVQTPTPSPAGHRRRQSGSLEGKLGLDSPLVSVAASMPPLAKPPLTSPSVLFAANVKTVSHPPLQSAVAHIIESVVNNHSSVVANTLHAPLTSLTGLPKTTLSLDMHLHSLEALAPTSTNQSNFSIKTPMASPSPVLAKHGMDPSAITDFSAVLVNKTTENIIIPKGRAGRDSSVDRTPIPPTIAASPKASNAGRGRRASTPRAVAIKAEKLSGVNAVIEDMISPAKSKGRGERKAASPGRGKGPATPRRQGPGRGKGKGKNVVGTRKDLAGTVYDIDLDEFEENSEEKIDLRALRERRKSSEVHSNADLKHHKSAELTNSSPLPLPVLHIEKLSRHHSRAFVVEKDKETHKVTSHERKEREQQQQPHHLKVQMQQPIAPKVETNSVASPVAADKGISSILQTPLPGPVDMRTYSSSASTLTSTVSGDEVVGKMKIGFPHAKDPSSEIASLFMSSSTGGGSSTTVNDLDELDKALEVLVSAPKPLTVPVLTMSGGTIVTMSPAPTPSQPSSQSAVNDVISNVNTSSQLKLQNNTQQPAATVNNIMAGGFGPIAPKEVDMPPTISHGGPAILQLARDREMSGDMSRNQLKVKIKGPFLDANYSSANSMPGSSSHPMQHHQIASVPSHASIYPPTNSYTPEPNYPPHHHQQWMMSSVVNNTSNLRRMRKKELLRQYWTQDMNMDGGPNTGFPGPSSSEMSGLPPSSAAHPISRSVITIPKAVASMSIIPTKEDYRLDDPNGNESNDSNGPMSYSGSSSFKGSMMGSGGGTERKRRSRGIYREMAALGILPPDAPKERRRERAAATATSATNDSNSRKRMKGNKEPSRSTFIPPTLAESEESSGGGKSGGPFTSSSLFSSGMSLKHNMSSASGTSAVSAVVVNHPTPKLKIKFGDLSISSNAGNNPGSSGPPSHMSNCSNHFGDSDKDTPNKKAKGRPPKKRGLPDTALAPPTMEELKRQSMKFREMIMQDYAMAEQQEILKLSGTRRKKHKRKAGSADSETDDGSVRSKSPSEPKPSPLIATEVVDGPKPKLILRFGKARSSTAGSDTSASAGAENSNGGSGGVGGSKENGLPGCGGQSDNSSQGPNNLEGLEHDSGFTGSSEGSSGGSVINVDTLLNSASNKPKENKSANGNNNNNNNSSSVCSGSSSSNAFRNGGAGSNGDKVLVLELDHNRTEAPNYGETSPSATQLVGTEEEDPSAKSGNVAGKGGSGTTKNASGKYVPIRLKLSRCYEGYSLKNKEGLGVDVVDRENGGAPNAAQQSDSCQVR